MRIFCPTFTPYHGSTPRNRRSPLASSYNLNHIGGGLRGPVSRSRELVSTRLSPGAENIKSPPHQPIIRVPPHGSGCMSPPPSHPAAIQSGMVGRTSWNSPLSPNQDRPSQLVRLDSPWMGQVHDRYLNKGQKMMRGQWGVEERGPMTTLLEIIIKKPGKRCLRNYYI